MPAAVAIPAIAAVAGAGISAGSQIYGAKKASKANERASAAEQKALEQQLQIERDNENRRREEYDREEAEKKRQFDAQQANVADEYAYRQPFRDTSYDALVKLSALSGLPAPARAASVMPTAVPVATAARTATGDVLTDDDAITLAMLAKGRRPPLTPALSAPPITNGMPMSALARRYA